MNTVNYIKVPQLSWASLYRTCKEHGYTCIEIMLVTKYPHSSEHIIGFSEINVSNVQLAMVLYHYNCIKVTLTATTHPSIISDDDYQWLLPYLQANNLLNHDIYMFYKDNNTTNTIQEINYVAYEYPDGYHYQKSRVYVYSNYVIRMWYIVNDIGCPPELQQLLTANVVNAMYIRTISNNVVANT